MWKKVFKFPCNKLALINNTNSNILYGNYGVACLNQGFVTPNNIENLRRKLSKQFKRVSNINKSKIFFRLPIWKAYTKKPMLSRMGKGSGNIVGWKALLKVGVIFLELLTIQPRSVTFKIFKRAIKSFPLKLIIYPKNNL
jgi:large subunit ribosomal protein L16